MSGDDMVGAFPLGPGLDFMRGLWRLNHALERVSAQMEATLGITAQQRMIIRCVGKYPGITAGQLAAQLHLHPGTISTALGRLESKGLLDRPRDQHDRRRVTLGLTEAGRALDRPARGTVESAIQKLLKTTSAADLARTRRVLVALAELLEGEVTGEDRREEDVGKARKRKRASSEGRKELGAER